MVPEPPWLSASSSLFPPEASSHQLPSSSTLPVLLKDSMETMDPHPEGPQHWLKFWSAFIGSLSTCAFQDYFMGPCALNHPFSELKDVTTSIVPNFSAIYVLAGITRHFVG